MSNRLSVREVRTPDDLAAVRDLCNGFLDWVRGHYGEKKWIVDRYYSPEKWAAVLDNLPEAHAPPEGEILVAHLDDRPVGCVMMQRLSGDACEMKRLFVRPEAQGHAVGRTLCMRLMAIAAQRGYGRMRLDTGVNHDGALSLYRSLGFRTRDPYYDPPAEILSHLVFMEAELPVTR